MLPNHSEFVFQHERSRKYVCRHYYATGSVLHTVSNHVSPAFKSTVLNKRGLRGSGGRTRPRVSRFVPQKVTRKAIRKQYVMSVLISRAHCLLQPRARQLPQENSLKICRQRLPSALALHWLFKRWHAICTPSAHFVTFCTLPQSGQRTLPESRCFCPRSPCGTHVRAQMLG